MWTDLLLDHLEGLIGFITGGGAAALAQEVRYTLQVARSSRVGAVLEDYHKIQEAMEACRDATGAMRVLLLRAHNGAAGLDAGTTMYSSVVHEAVGEGVEPAKPRWQGQILDLEYLSLLRDLLTQHTITLELSKMKEGSRLFDVYKSSGIARSMVVLVRARRRRTNIWYLSVALPDEVQIDAQIRDEVAVLETRVRSALGWR